MTWLLNLFEIQPFTRILLGFFALLFLLFSLLLPWWPRRPGQAVRDDKQMGFRAVLHLFLSVSICILVQGAALIVHGGFEQFFRGGNERLFIVNTGLAFGASGAALALLFGFTLWFGTNDRQHPEMNRLYTVLRFGVHCFVLVVAGVWLALLLIDFRPPDGQTYLRWRIQQRHLLSVIVVWGTSWIVHFWLLSKQGSSQPAKSAKTHLTWDVAPESATSGESESGSESVSLPERPPVSRLQRT